MAKKLCLFLFLIAASSSSFGQESSPRYEFLKYNSQKTRSLKHGREIKIFTTNSDSETLLKKRVQYIQGKLINKTDSFILIQLTEEQIDMTYGDSSVFYFRYSHRSSFLSEKEVRVSTIHYITYQPNLYYAGAILTSIGALGTVMTPFSIKLPHLFI